MPHSLRLALFPFVIATASASAQTVGVTVNEPGAYPGYTLFSPLAYTETYLIDMEGRVINEWASDYVVGNSAYLLEDGDLLRCADPGSPFFVAGGDAGLVERYSWEGSWSGRSSTPTRRSVTTTTSPRSPTATC